MIRTETDAVGNCLFDGQKRVRQVDSIKKRRARHDARERVRGVLISVSGERGERFKLAERLDPAADGRAVGETPFLDSNGVVCGPQ